MYPVRSTVRAEDRSSRAGALAIATSALALLALSIPASAQSADGAELFVSLKCNVCHAVPAAEIEAKAKSEKVRGADLGTAESTLTAEEMTSYVLREAELDGKEHKKEFKGSEEELAVVIAWLVELSEQARVAAEGR